MLSGPLSPLGCVVGFVLFLFIGFSTAEQICRKAASALLGA